MGPPMGASMGMPPMGPPMGASMGMPPMGPPMGMPPMGAPMGAPIASMRAPPMGGAMASMRAPVGGMTSSMRGPMASTRMPVGGGDALANAMSNGPGTVACVIHHPPKRREVTPGTSTAVHSLPLASQI